MSILQWSMGTLAEVKSIYLICKERNKVKQVIRSCTQRKREKTKRYAEAPTASLPHFRVNPAKPFSYTGLEFAGPLLSRRLKE